MSIKIALSNLILFHIKSTQIDGITISKAVTCPVDSSNLNIVVKQGFQNFLLPVLMILFLQDVIKVV